MAMRPLGKEEALQHLFVLAIAAFMIVAPPFMVKPDYAEYGLMVLGGLLALVDLVVAAALRRPPAS